MKTICILFFLILTSTFLQAQTKPDTIPATGDKNKRLKEITNEKDKLLKDDPTGTEPKKTVQVDTTVQNKYGDLLNDDPLFNKKYPLWVPAAEAIGFNTLTFGVDRYIFKYPYATEVGYSSWKHNIKAGWEWDNDRFGINFIGHPYSGTLSFNAARSNGYNYWQSFPLAVGGSLMWEYFGENTRPSYNDIINTPVNGAFLGEILYRISSNILDDRSRGAQRVVRELAAGLINPARGFSRLVQGKTFRKTDKEVYQKEPLNITLFGGVHLQNNNYKDVFKTSATNFMVNLQLDYGNPFENRTRKPFDFFKLRLDFRYGKGVGRKYLDNVAGYGILGGKNFYSKSKDNAMLIGAFQHYDYWDNKTFELGAIGFGGGIITKLLVHKPSKSNLYTSLHLALVPFAGSSARFGPDSSEYRDYNFGGGLEGKFESTINLGKWATATMVAYYYWVHSYAGLKENNIVAILRPRITITLIKNLSIGYEQFMYVNDRYIHNIDPLRLVRTEEKLFLLIYLEDKQRRGHYN